ncbi:unnamed protein product [Psylliodes chrysocephalus]|uniref:Regulatory protein zeste n=1 Tax=Psylliodes chrysocephalus TaxID=3402493 RepID=A0A9P0CXI6_9CUCU|nr:unnamed protein product [Psylliodes chrysocephala]
MKNRKYKNIIENKETGGVTWKNKEEAWKNVEREFSSNSSTPRLEEVLKRYYNNKKKETRKQTLVQNVKFKRTGGGMPIVNVKDNAVFNLFGLHNNFDDDVESDLEQAQSMDESPAKLLICTPSSSGGTVVGSSSLLSTVASSSTAGRAVISIKSGIIDRKRNRESQEKMWL